MYGAYFSDPYQRDPRRLPTNPHGYIPFNYGQYPQYNRQHQPQYQGSPLQGTPLQGQFLANQHGSVPLNYTQYLQYQPQVQPQAYPQQMYHQPQMLYWPATVNIYPNQIVNNYNDGYEWDPESGDWNNPKDQPNQKPAQPEKHICLRCKAANEPAGNTMPERELNNQPAPRPIPFMVMENGVLRRIATPPEFNGVRENVQRPPPA